MAQQPADERSRSLMQRALHDGVAQPARWLVVEDLLLAQELRGVSWHRSAAEGPGAAAEPPAGTFDAVAMRLPRGQAALDLALHLSAARLAPGASLWLYGANDEGIRSADAHLAPLFEQVETIDTRKHARLWRGRRTLAPARGRLADWEQRAEVTLLGAPVSVLSYPGLFAGGSLDAGSALLIDALARLPAPQRALDFACGPGMLSLAMARLWPAAQLHGLDADALAVEAARRNLGVPVVLGDGWAGAAALPAGDYDLVVSNPPLHRGNALDLAVLEALIAGAPARLARGGALVLVTQRQRPVSELMQRSLGPPTLLAEDGRFRVWLARRRQTAS